MELWKMHVAIPCKLMTVKNLLSINLDTTCLNMQLFWKMLGWQELLAIGPEGELISWQLLLVLQLVSIPNKQ